MLQNIASRESIVVSTATRIGTGKSGVKIPAEECNFNLFPQYFQAACGAHQKSRLDVKCSSKVEDDWSYTSAFPIRLHFMDRKNSKSKRNLYPGFFYVI
jgi:hypothetical protein